MALEQQPLGPVANLLPRPRSQPRKVPRMGQGIVQTSSQMITRGTDLSYPFGRPVCLATPAEDAVIGLGLDAPGPHLFGQTVGRGEDEGVSGTEELDRSRGFAAAPAAV